VYHAMILGGAFLLVTGARGGFWFILGVVLVVAGISVELSILVWSASLARSAPSSVEVSDRSTSRTRTSSSPRICVACGHESEPGTVVCPRCGRSVVSLGPVD